MLEPTIFPITISSTFNRIDCRQAASSGKLVPPATITTPIIKGDTFNIDAKLTEPLIKSLRQRFVRSSSYSWTSLNSIKRHYSSPSAYSAQPIAVTQTFRVDIDFT